MTPYVMLYLDYLSVFFTYLCVYEVWFRDWVYICHYQKCHLADTYTSKKVEFSIKSHENKM